ncbi:MAG TPA: zinc dependent phospholipase C family protein [Mucilaginibacter sp.]|nr:zinc dependent phospholipase C family protein [Mucilaginibacter sp.]
MFALISFSPLSSKAYSVFAHEAVIDASWEKSIMPLLKKKYPNATAEELKVAHSYAYGGSLMPDMGYFPFGSVYFTDLVHYVRTGDFIENLLNESKNINEYAFALGALAHYMTDKYGHSLATNIAVPIVYPKIGKEFGKVVTYENDHISHSRMEFGFDVLQTARGNYASQAYHDFIGFNVARPVLERAFLKTYGEDINDVFGNLTLAISTFRWSVRSLLPGLTRTAWQLKKDEIKKANPAINSRAFHHRIKRKEYFREFGKDRMKPKFNERVWAFILNIMPKIGPLKALKFKDPGPVGEKLFIKSFDTVLVCYAQVLQQLQHEKINLPDIDFDTGKETAPGEYGIADKTYSLLLIKLQDGKFKNVTLPLKDNILSFYNKADTTTKSNEHKKAKIDWQKTYLALQEIRVKSPVSMDSLKFPVDSVAKAVSKSSQ